MSEVHDFLKGPSCLKAMDQLSVIFLPATSFSNTFLPRTVYFWAYTCLYGFSCVESILSCR